MAYSDPAAFFDHFRLREWQGPNGVDYLAKDIMTRVQLFRNIREDQVGLVDYTVQEGQRADHIAQAYYGEERLAWLVYLVNNILDPFHHWPKTANELNDHIIAKYGSVAQAQKFIHHWRINWPEDETTISPAQYSALYSYEKNYWNAAFGYDNEVVYYARKPLPEIIHTNRIAEITLTDPDAYTFEPGMKVRDSALDGINGEVEAFYDGKLVIKNINGAWNGIGTIINSTGDTDIDTETTYSGYNIIKNNLADVEGYWVSVSNYDYEDEINEEKKHIKLLDRQFVPLITDNLRDLVTNV